MPSAIVESGALTVPSPFGDPFVDTKTPSRGAPVIVPGSSGGSVTGPVGVVGSSELLPHATSNVSATLRPRIPMAARSSRASGACRRFSTSAGFRFGYKRDDPVSPTPCTACGAENVENGVCTRCGFASGIGHTCPHCGAVARVEPKGAGWVCGRETLSRSTTWRLLATALCGSLRQASTSITFDPAAPPRSLVLHSKETTATGPDAGNAGDRIACLTIS